MHTGRARHHDFDGKNCLTGSTSRGTLPLRSRKASPQASIGQGLLAPIREGKVVVLKVDDPQAPRKKRAPKPKLFFVPFTSMGHGPSPLLLISLEAHGSEVVDTRGPVALAVFIRLGLSFRMAEAVRRELDLVFRLEKA